MQLIIPASVAIPVRYTGTSVAFASAAAGATKDIVLTLNKDFLFLMVERSVTNSGDTATNNFNVKISELWKVSASANISKRDLDADYIPQLQAGAFQNYGAKQRPWTIFGKNTVLTVTVKDLAGSNTTTCTAVLDGFEILRPDWFGLDDNGNPLQNR